MIEYQTIPAIITATYQGRRVHVADEAMAIGAPSLYRAYPMPGQVVDGITVYEGITADELTNIREHETWEAALIDGSILLTAGEAADLAFAKWTRGEYMTFDMMAARDWEEDRHMYSDLRRGG